jgi:hypothetical protein
MTTTTTTKKPTKRECFNALYTHFQETGRDCGNIPAEVMMDFLEKEITQLEKKNANKKPTAQQSANEGIKEAILEGLVEHMTITEMQKSTPELAELSNQRIPALVRQMVDAGIIIRTEDKRKAYFSKA